MSSACTDPHCPNYTLLCEEQLRCSRLGAANEVLREAQQFLMGKSNAAHEHANMLMLELESLRKDRDELLKGIRNERLELQAQRDELQQNWEKMERMQASLAFATKQATLVQQENSLLRDQVVTLQETVNRLSDKLDQFHQRSSQQQDAYRTLPLGDDVTNISGVTQDDEAPRVGWNAAQRFTDPPNLYHSPQKAAPLVNPPHSSIASESRMKQTHFGGQRKLMPNEDAVLARAVSTERRMVSPSATDREVDDIRPERGSPDQRGSLHTPDRVFVPSVVSPATMPTPLHEYTQSIKAALDLAKYASAGLSSKLPPLRTSPDVHPSQSENASPPADTQRGTSSDVPQQQQQFSLETANDMLNSLTAFRRFDIDTGVSATVALQRFRDQQQHLSSVGGFEHATEDASPPPPPPPPEDDDEPSYHTVAKSGSPPLAEAASTPSVPPADMKQAAPVTTSYAARSLEILGIPSRPTSVLSFSSLHAMEPTKRDSPSRARGVRSDYGQLPSIAPASSFGRSAASSLQPQRLAQHHDPSFSSSTSTAPNFMEE